MSEVQREPESQPEVPEILMSYAETVQRRTRLRKAFVVGIPAILLIAAILEMAINNTAVLIIGEAAIIAIAGVLAIMMSYSFVVFWLAWEFAGACMRKGQTRIAYGHFAGIIVFSLLAALVFGFVLANEKRTLLDNVLTPFFLFWINSGLGCVGYFFRFYRERSADL